MIDDGDWGLLEPLASGSGAPSLTGDDAVLAALIEVEAALSTAWMDVGLAPAWVEEVAAAMIDTPIDRDALGRGSRADGNPVIPLVMALREHSERVRAGSGDWLHRGATSQDIFDSAFMLVAFRAVAATSGSLRSLATILASLASDHRETLMAGRTLTQHAAPITFGVKAAGWLDGVESALAGLEGLTLPVQLAGSVGIGAAFADLSGEQEAPAHLRAALASRLGLADPGRSWQVERTPVAHLGSALATTIGVLGRISADVLVLARTEIAEVSEGGGGSSSAMPQKRNPATAVLVSAAAQRSPALLSTLFSALVSADERPAATWHSEWQAARQLLALAVEASAASVALLDGLVVDAERMLANLGLTDGLIYSEQVLSELTRDLGRTEASAIVTAAIHGGEQFARAVPTELSTVPTLRAAGVVVDAALARHIARRERRGSR